VAVATILQIALGQDRTNHEHTEAQDMASFVIDYFELPTSGIGTSTDFFGKAFGWGNKAYGPGYSEIIEAGVLGGLSSAAELSGPTIGIRTDDIEAAVAAIEKAGGTITVPPYPYPGGHRFIFREPGGSQMLVYCPSE
jgi:predicted enzyme related to lactoylglutathione lyase